MSRTAVRHRLSALLLLLALAAVPAVGGATADAGPMLVGFGTRTITPVGTPPAEWAQYFTPHATTGVWGEPYQDLDGDGCLDGATNRNLEPLLEGQPPRGEQPEPHVDQPWNSLGDGFGTTPSRYAVRGVSIVGDPQSTGKWDGLWANAGFGAKCTLGAHDDTWARAVVMEQGGTTVAMVSLDVVGFFNVEVRRARAEMALRYPDMGIDELVISSTHTHEGVDTMGYWGQLYLNTDGKFPAYQAYIRSQILDAVRQAWASREPAVAKFATAEHATGIRDSRGPQVIDPTVVAAQFLRPADQTTIGTIVNWSNHPEAQGSNNPLVSSDFAHGARETLEARLGGTAVYFSGSVGGLMTPLGVDIPGYGSQVSWERTFEVGRLVAVAAADALAQAPLQTLDGLAAKRREFYINADNTLLRVLNVRGVFDLPTYVGGDSYGPDPAAHKAGTFAGAVGEQNLTEMVAVTIGPAMFLTVPGELFPELELGGYGRADCPAAKTGRPFEPPIKDSFDQRYQFVLGLGQDELGYIVPGYDFYLTEANGVPVGGVEAVDACGEGHYEESVSISSNFAPWVTCVAAELGSQLGGRADDAWADPACSRENTGVGGPYGIDPALKQPKAVAHLGTAPLAR